MPQYGFVVDVTRCIGCRGCVAACVNENNLDPYLHWREVLEVETGASTSNAQLITVSLACNHCANPACRNACPVGAISKNTDGVVLIDEAVCIGCRMCEAACPYGAPVFDAAKKKTGKCTLCYHRLGSGSTNAEDKVPACVSTCPGKALWFGETGAAPTFGKKIEVSASTPPQGFADAASTTPTIQFTKVSS